MVCYFTPITSESVGGQYGLLVGHFFYLPLGSSSPSVLAQGGRKRKCLIYWLLLCDGFLTYKLGKADLYSPVI